MPLPVAPPVDRGDTVIAVAGDWHARSLWATKAVRHAAEAGIKTILHVGDFGIFQFKYAEDYLDSVERAAAASDIVIWVTDGNHEDHELRLAYADLFGDQPAQIRPHIWLFPRGYRWTHANRSFISFGGAPSISRPKLSWWPEEMITEHDVARAIIGGRADVMISHDAPMPATRAVDQVRSTNPLGIPMNVLGYANLGAERLTRAYEGVSPGLLFHGHHHVKDSIRFPDGRRIFSLGKDSDDGNVAILDLTDLSVAWLNIESSHTPRQLLSWERAYRAPIH
jgi:hypothetical protein